MGEGGCEATHKEQSMTQKWIITQVPYQVFLNQYCDLIIESNYGMRFDKSWLKQAW